MENVKSVLEMARGAIMERVDVEMPKIIQNIMDPNTKATKPRELTVTLVLTPDDSRQMVALDSTVKVKLVPYSPIRTNLYITDAADGSDGYTVVEMTPDIPGQLRMFGQEETEPPAIMRLYHPEKEERKNA